MLEKINYIPQRWGGGWGYPIAEYSAKKIILIFEPLPWLVRIRLVMSVRKVLKFRQGIQEILDLSRIVEGTGPLQSTASRGQMESLPDIYIVPR